VVGKGYKRNSLYLLAATPSLEDQMAYVVNGPSSSLNPELPLMALASRKTSLEADIDVWHCQLGHVNVQSILKLLKKGMVDGMAISISKKGHDDYCKPCLEGKQHCAVIPSKSDVESPRVLHRTYSDVCGPMETTARKGYHYFITFIDSYSHRLVVKLIKLKNEVPRLTREYLERAEAETGEHANYFRSDGGREYGLTVLQDYFKSKGIHHEMTNAYTPQENGVSKCMNRTLVEMACAMLSDAGLPNAYWVDAILYATHVLNRVPTYTIANGLTPHEAFTGNRPSVMHLRIFGCKAHVHVPDEKWRKLDAKSVECIFLGFAENQKAYVCVHHPSGHILESRDIVFDEGSANAPSHIKIDDPCLNIEETKRSAVGTVPEAIQTTSYSPVGDGETVSANKDSDGESVDGTPSERVSDIENVLIHPPVSSDPTGSSPDGVLSCHIARVKVAVERQVSRGQRQGKRPKRTSDGRSGHPFAPLSLYPVPIPTSAVRRSSRTHRAPIHDDDSRFFINAYKRTTLEEEIQLNNEGMDNLPRRIEGLDAGGETDTCADIVGCDESHCDTLTQSARHAATAMPLDSEPLTYSDAVSHPDANLWLGAMGVELNTFKEIGLYQEVKMPPNRKIIDSKWVFKIKLGPNGEIDKYKARLVAKGYMQIEGLNYTDTFAPVTKFTTIRSLLALAAQHNLEVHQVDVKAAFLNGELEEEIYLRPPPGFHDNSKVVWHLQRALYGLK